MKRSFTFSCKNQKTIVRKTSLKANKPELLRVSLYLVCHIFESITYVMNVMNHQDPSSRKDILPQLSSIIHFRECLCCKGTHFSRLHPSWASPNPMTDGGRSVNYWPSRSSVHWSWSSRAPPWGELRPNITNNWNSALFFSGLTESLITRPVLNNHSAN